MKLIKKIKKQKNKKTNEVKKRSMQAGLLA